MKKLTKKIGMSTLALASVFTLGVSASKAVNTSSINQIETQAINTAPSVDEINGVTMTSAYDVTYGYYIETINSGKTVDQSFVALQVEGIIPASLLDANNRTWYGVTLQKAGGVETQISNSDGTGNTHYLDTTADKNSANQTVRVADFDSTDLDNNGTTDTTNYLMESLSTLEKDTTYTMRIYLSNSPFYAFDGDEADATWKTGKTEWVEFTFTTPEMAPTLNAVNVYANTNVGTITRSDAHGNLDSSDVATMNTFSANNFYSGSSANVTAEANELATITTNNELMYYTIDVRTETTNPQDADSSYLELDVLTNAPSFVTADDLTFYWAIEANDIVTDASAKANASLIGEQYMWTLSTSADTQIDDAFDTIEAGETYSFNFLVSDDTEIDSTNNGTVDTGVTTEVLFTLDVTTPTHYSGNYKFNSYSVNIEDEPFYNQPGGIASIVLASVFGITTIGLGAYMVIQNNKSKKASASTKK